MTKTAAKAGVDEAGRGPCLGPMVMAIVSANQKQQNLLNKLGVKDSKVLTEKKRKDLARHIKQLCNYVIISVSPNQIDAALKSETSSLNHLEAITTTKLINRLLKKETPQSILLDLPSKNKEQYLRDVCANLTVESKQVILDAQFKADENDVTVAAASILAKTTRDAAIKVAQKKLGFAIGSGYPSDPNTQKCLQEHFDALKESGILRTTWKTITAIEVNKQQKTLTGF